MQIIEGAVYMGAATPGTGGTPINNQDISVTANGTYTADEGYTGLGTVSVNVPNPSTGTKSITANGVYDVTAFASADVQVPTTAPDYYVALSDNGSGVLVKSGPVLSVPTGSTVNTIPERGLYYEYYKGALPSNINVDLSGITTLGDYALDHAFYNATGSFSIDLSNLSTIGINSLDSTFENSGITALDLSSLSSIETDNLCKGCTGLTSLAVSNNTSLTGSSCFNGCTSLASVTGKVVVGSGADSSFYGCSSLTDPSKFGFASTLSNDASCFYGCSGLSGAIDMSGTTTINGSCLSMFEGCSGITSVDLSALSSVSTSQACKQMFKDCTSLTSADLSGITSLSNSSENGHFNRVFSGCTSLTSVDFGGLTSVSGAEVFFRAFEGCALTSADFSSLTSVASYCFQYAFDSGTGALNADFSSVTSVSEYSFYGAFTNYTGTLDIDFSGLEGSSGTNAFMTMCSGATGLRTADFSNLLAFSSYRGFQRTFENCTNLTSVNFGNLVRMQGREGFLNSFYNCQNLTTVNFDNLLVIDGQKGFDTAFYNCSSLTSLNFPKLARIYTYSSEPAFNYMCQGCTSLSSISFSGLPYNTNINDSSWQYMLSGVTGCTVHFPAEWQTPMSTWTNVLNGFGGTNTTVLFDLPNQRDIDLTRFETLHFYYGLYNAYNGCSNITSVDLSNLKFASAQNALASAFQSCTNLTTLDMSSFVFGSSGGSTISYLCKDCTSLTTVKFDSFKWIRGYSGARYVFQNCTSLTDLYFPAWQKYVQTSTFTGFLDGCTGVTVHLPANKSVPANFFGGTNTVVLYDLPSAFVLTGANSSQYERNPKYDTSSALAWRIKDIESDYADQYVVDFTPYYTSGTTDPQVGDTLYSDSACTTAVTTISSIA